MLASTDHTSPTRGSQREEAVRDAEYMSVHIFVQEEEKERLGCVCSCTEAKKEGSVEADQ